MHVILLLQAGDDGPVKMVVATDKGIERATARVQYGCPEWVHVRGVLDGDERLEAVLGMTFADHMRDTGWYGRAVLDLVPDDIARYGGFDGDDERRRIAILRMGAIR